MAEKIIRPQSMDSVPCIFGSKDENVIIVEDAFLVSISVRRDEICISGDSEENCVKASNVVGRLIELADSGEVITRQLVAYLCDLASDGKISAVQNYSADVICLTSKGRPLKAKTNGQKNYIDAIKNNSVTFGIGPAGTGKTYLAVAMAVTAFKKNEVSRIILTRPAVEAGEKLGFLPGDLQNKVDPYLRPLYDALYDVMGLDSYQRNFERGAIEIAPLAYMRGRTLDDAFIILDEAQNTTPEQLKMFLTRIGVGSKAVVTGDVTQIDLPPDKRSGLKSIQNILKDIDDIAFIKLTDRDVVRHELVQKIIKAYESYEKRRNDQK
ncbi:MAG: PhoH family protein [Ruminococcaceae bacterium]|nr:PhoH family protein [Oscillospiraceae bacterium]